MKPKRMLQKPVIGRLLPKLAQPKIGPYGSATVSIKFAERAERDSGRTESTMLVPFVPCALLPTLDDSP